MQRKSNLSIEDIKVGDTIITRSPIYFGANVSALKKYIAIEEGQFVTVLEINKYSYGNNSGYFYKVTLNRRGAYSKVSVYWKHLRKRIIVKDR